MKTKVLILTGFFLLWAISFLYAAWDKRPEFRLAQTYRYDLRQDNHQLYTDRLSLTFSYLDREQKSLFKLTPFFEIRRNIDKDLWERKEAGAEISKDIFPWLYVGQAIQTVWAKEDYRYFASYERNDYTESETRLCLSYDLVSRDWLRLRGFILNEYSYNLDKSEGIRNEIAAGVIIPLGKYLETDIHWRHIDRIHYYDSDVFEAAVTLVF